jgi:Flp pilus assembly pilin Flp
MAFKAFGAWIKARLGIDERGANMVEYVLILVAIAVVVIVVVAGVGGQVSARFSDANSQFPGP